MMILTLYSAPNVHGKAMLLTHTRQSVGLTEISQGIQARRGDGRKGWRRIRRAAPRPLRGFFLTHGSCLAPPTGEGAVWDSRRSVDTPYL